MCPFHLTRRLQGNFRPFQRKQGGGLRGRTATPAQSAPSEGASSTTQRSAVSSLNIRKQDRAYFCNS